MRILLSVVLLAAVLSTLLCGLILHSRVGRVLVAIRQNEALIEAAGVQSWRYKLMAFVVSASLAGLAGALYAHFISFLNPDAFGVDHSLNAILAVILGGSGTLAGPAVGAFAVVFLPEYLRVAETYRLVIYGFILVAATIFMPRGLVPLLSQGLRQSLLGQQAVGHKPLADTKAAIVRLLQDFDELLLRDDAPGGEDFADAFSSE